MINLIERRTLSRLGSSIGGGLALVVLFLLCALTALLAPSIQATHAWISLFTLAPVTSPQAWLEGSFFSLVFGGIVGSVFASVHNAISARGL
ncbi:MAG: hypothetical protein J0I99_15985 [Devosia sp.]|uniref:hypothetical protein n=1 Tax=Devosia sp. TaxID=1871048 RepID=UPI001AC1E8F1|nr:hypothetical protein [Devosia sp.]MBN9308509.1 hypothetical protein [Devosia sp.]MBN9317243.1 hypothetical protein [Devosia sp.]